jgi:hypothetical protein
MTHIEDRLEELFVADARSRTLTSVGIARRSAWPGVVAFVGAAAALAFVALAVIAGSRGGADVASPSTSVVPTATVAPTGTKAPTATVAPTAAPVTTGTVSGKLGFPSDYIPALAIYALPVDNLSDGRYVVLTEEWRGVGPGGTYTLSVPEGTYYFVAYTRTKPNPQSGTMSGGYTQYVRCGLQPTCADHTLVPVTVTAGQTFTNIDIRDWYSRDFPPRPS